MRTGWAISQVQESDEVSQLLRVKGAANMGIWSAGETVVPSAKIVKQVKKLGERVTGLGFRCLKI